jgi:streptomycin 6-kinase
LLPNLWIEPSPDASFSSLAEMCEQWVAASESRLDYLQLSEDGLFRDAVAVWKELASSTTAPVLLHTDLHAGNVLVSRRQSWLAIDPKPFVGDPAYDVLQHITNCPGRLAADPFALCERMASLTQVTTERVRLWLFGRLVIDSQWPFGTTGSPTNYDVAKLLKV